MKTNPFTLKAAGKVLALSAFAVIALTIGSCNKNEGIGKPECSSSAETTKKSEDLNSSIAKALQRVAISQSDASRTDWSDPAYNYKTYTTPNGKVHSWTDPTTGTSFKLTQSSGGGGGLGSMEYNNKTFDYNFVLSIKASAKDPDWDGFLNGRDLRGVVAIDGDLTDTDFTLRNLAIFLVLTKGSSGTYEFIDWDSPTVGQGDGIGELLDFTSLGKPTLANFADAKQFITSSGHVKVTDSELTLQSDAKIEDVKTGSKYSIKGSISYE